MNPSDYEAFVQKVMRELGAESGIEVHRHRVYKGKVSGRDIDVDVSFEADVIGSRILVLVECKHYAARVPVDDVEEFHSKIDDIGAHKGIMVTTVGFQDGAIKTAKGRGIALALLTKERQKGEMRYVVNSAAPPSPPKPSDALLQGNLRPFGNWWGGDHEGGFRFGSAGQLWSFLALADYEQRMSGRDRRQAPEDQQTGRR